MAAKRCDMYEDDSSAENGSLPEFADLSVPEIFDIFIGSKDARHSRAVIEASLKVLADYCVKSSRTTLADLERMSPVDLGDFLQTFYTEVRQPDGLPYSKRSLVALRHGLRQHFQVAHHTDIITDDAYKSANQIFNTIVPVVKLRMSIPMKNVHVICKEDMDKIRSSYLTDCSTPKGLQNTVFLNMMLHFCCTAYGRWNLRVMKKANFSIMTDVVSNRRFVYFIFVGNLSKDKMCNAELPREGHKDSENGDGEESDEDISIDKVRMYEAPDKPDCCPVAAFEKYMAKLDPKCDDFWQRPRKYKRNDNYWYDGVAIGVNCLGYKMRDISTFAGCSRVYSNHCLKVTSRECTLRMREIGSECTCSAQHFLPGRDFSDASFHDYGTTDNGMQDTELLNFIKEEPGDVESTCISCSFGNEVDTRPGLPGGISDRLDRGESLPDNNYYMSLPLGGFTAPRGILHSTAASQPASSPAYPVQTPNRVLPNYTYTVGVNANPNPQRQHIEEQCRRGQGSSEPPSAWKVVSTWLSENNERKWLLTQEVENEQRSWLLSQNSSSSPTQQGAWRADADRQTQRSFPQGDGFQNQTGQNVSPNLTSGQHVSSQGQRSRYSGSKPTEVHIDGRDPSEGSTPSAAQVTQDVAAPTGGSGGITADNEVLQLQKDVLRLQRANLVLERRKMELEIAKLESETQMMRGGS